MGVQSPSTLPSVCIEPLQALAMTERHIQRLFEDSH